MNVTEFRAALRCAYEAGQHSVQEVRPKEVLSDEPIDFAAWYMTKGKYEIQDEMKYACHICD